MNLFTRNIPYCHLLKYLLFLLKHLVCICIFLYVCVMYAEALKTPLSPLENQLFNYIFRSKTLYKTSCMYIYFWKWVISNHGGSTEAAPGCGRVSHVFFSEMIGRFVFVILRIASGCRQICAHTAPLCLPACPDKAYVGTLYVIDLAENQIKYFLSYFHVSSSFDMSATSDWFLMCSYSVMILYFRLLRIAKETLIIAASCYAKVCSLSRSGFFGFANH